MSASVRFHHIDHNHVGFSGDRDILYELRNKYSFYAPNYKFDKRFKLGYWDGKLSILNMKDFKMYAGLLPEITQYLNSEGIDYTDDTNLVEGHSVDDDAILEFYKRIKGPFVPHESQVDAMRECIGRGRNIILAPTSNGKSYIIHGLNAFYKFKKKRVLIIIHRSQLVLQLKSNFVDEYGSDEFYSTSTIYDDDQNTDVLISTWQSLQDTPESWFKQFDVIIADEVHGFKAKSLITLIGKCGHIEYRHGFTATLDNNSKTDALTLEGMFGVPYQTITLEEQIAQGISARPIVYVFMLKYPIEDRLELINQIKTDQKDAVESRKKNSETIFFQTESKYLESHQRRNEFIIKVAKAQKGNTLIAFKNEEHGKTLYELINKNITDQPTYLIYGKVKKERRFEIQKEITKLKESTSAVSFGTFSTGINIPNLNNLIIGSQVKSEITVPQLIGRMMRLSEGKTTSNIIDMCDDLSHNGNKNVFYRHFEQRLKFYLKNNFEIKYKSIAL